MPFTYDHPRPAVTVDLALFAAEGRELQIVLIQRKQDPFAGRWALPGGFVDVDEDLAAAARRELREETGLRGGRLVQLGAYGKPGRDPRGHTVSVVFLAACDRRKALAVAGDDASACAWWPLRKLPRLAFDHKEIVRFAAERFAAIAADRARLAHDLLGPRQADLAAALRRAAKASTGAAKGRKRR